MAQVSWSRPPGHLLCPLLLKDMLSRTVCLETQRGGPSSQGSGPGVSHQERLRRVHRQDPRRACRPQARCLWLRRGEWEPAPRSRSFSEPGRPAERRVRTGGEAGQGGRRVRQGGSQTGARPWVVIPRGDWISCLHRGLGQRGQCKVVHPCRGPALVGTRGMGWEA